MLFSSPNHQLNLEQEATAESYQPRQFGHEIFNWAKPVSQGGRGGAALLAPNLMESITELQPEVRLRLKSHSDKILPLEPYRGSFIVCYDWSLSETSPGFQAIEQEVTSRAKASDLWQQLGLSPDAAETALANDSFRKELMYSVLFWQLRGQNIAYDKIEDRESIQTELKETLSKASRLELNEAQWSTLQIVGGDRPSAPHTEVSAVPAPSLKISGYQSYGFTIHAFPLEQKVDSDSAFERLSPDQQRELLYELSTLLSEEVAQNCADRIQADAVLQGNERNGYVVRDIETGQTNHSTLIEIPNSYFSERANLLELISSIPDDIKAKMETRAAARAEPEIGEVDFDLVFDKISLTACREGLKFESAIWPDVSSAEIWL